MRVKARYAKAKTTLAAVFFSCLLWAAAAAWSNGGGSAGLQSPHNLDYFNDAACSACHSAHNASAENLVLKENLAAVCLNCHNGSGVASFPGVDAGRVHSFGPNLNPGCSGCHQNHPPYYYAPLLLRQYTGENLAVNRSASQGISDYSLCLDCHNNRNRWGAANIDQYYTGGTGHFIRSAGGVFNPGWQLSCSNCHNVHGTQNAKHIRTAINVTRGTDPAAVTVSYPSSPSSAAQIREFCFTCHAPGSFIYGIGTGLPAVISEHSPGPDGGTASCTDCHGYAGAATNNRLLKGIHAPIVPLPAASELIILENTVYGPAYFQLAAELFYLSPPPAGVRYAITGKTVAFKIISGSGKLQSLALLDDEPQFSDLASPYEIVTDARGGASVWVYVPEGDTTIVRFESAGAVKEITLSVPIAEP
jgi:predicted CXXCH cytochrome family protein